MDTKVHEGKSSSGLRSTVFAGFCVQTLVGEAKAFYGVAAYDVRLDDLVYVRLGDVAVPDGFGIYDYVRTVLALIEATGLVGADAAFQSAGGQLLFKEFLQAGFG